MYLFFTLLLLIIIFFYCIGYYRRKKIIKKICCMCRNEKYEIIDNLLEPFGYAYVPAQDVFTSRMDAWQKNFGYSAFYDKAAPHLGIVINSLPVYFNYDGRTWLIEFWKGQYGINTGCEIGVYRADRILDKSELDHTLFKSLDTHYMPELSFAFYNAEKDMEIAQLCGKHWWLTAFKPGLFSIPSSLTVWSSVTLYSHEMASAFANALINLGYSTSEVTLHRNTVTFTFEGGKPVCGIFRRIITSIAQSLNWLGCQIYLFITRPFTLSVDRVLFLYYYLPFIFRRMLNIRKHKLACEK
ncbi:MAG: DUF4474 domain-containing protein [Lachnospiraceae bacterium]|nr:DUF4474 domain-containing protein [Lachnospiraceae bacterium]